MLLENCEQAISNVCKARGIRGLCYFSGSVNLQEMWKRACRKLLYILDKDLLRRMSLWITKSQQWPITHFYNSLDLAPQLPLFLSTADISQLSIIPFARIYCDVHENRVFAKIFRLLDSTQGCCTTMTSQTVIPDHVPRNESNKQPIPGGNHLTKQINQP